MAFLSRSREVGPLDGVDLLLADLDGVVYAAPVFFHFVQLITAR